MVVDIQVDAPPFLECDVCYSSRWSTFPEVPPEDIPACWHIPRCELHLFYLIDGWCSACDALTERTPT